MYWTSNEGKFVVAEILKNKIVKHMTSVSKRVSIDKLDQIVHQDNNTYRSIIKTKHVHEKSRTYIDFSIKHNNQYPKFKVSDHLRILKYRNIFAKGYIPKLEWRIFCD